MKDTKMRAGGVAAALAVAALALAGCGEPSPEGSTRVDTGGLGRARAWVIETPDGRDVTCISWSAGRGGGVDCDWGSQ